MFQYAFCGELAKDQDIKILILGESHHWEKNDYGDTPERISHRQQKEALYKTEDVVKTYLKNWRDAGCCESAHHFFDKIVQAFGIDPNTSREEFWKRVYFGNYINKMCGVGDDRAVQLLKEANNTECYNNELFDFINDHNINVVCCFSRRVYAKLPAFADKALERCDPIGNISIKCKTGSEKRDRINRCEYLPNTPHKGTQIMLNQSLKVYGMLHPSGRYGFDPGNYAFVLSELIKL